MPKHRIALDHRKNGHMNMRFQKLILSDEWKKIENVWVPSFFFISQNRVIMEIRRLAILTKPWRQHKRLRERIWILPIPSLHPSKNTLAGPTTLSSSTSNASPATPASPHPSFLGSLAQHQPQSLQVSASVSAAAGARAEDDAAVPESALDVEFEQIWDRVPEEGLDDDDLLQMRAWVHFIFLLFSAFLPHSFKPPFPP